MKPLLTVAAVLACIFASTFLILKLSGVLTVDDIEYFLQSASDINPLYVAALVIAILFADLFIAVPTMTVTLLSGYFLGAVVGGVSALIGMMFAATTGYIISRKFGPSLLYRIYKDEQKLSEMRTIFGRHGAFVLLICRAAPILPELCCCLSGATKMPFIRFILYFSIGTVPYAFIASYAGSISTLSNPKPAILTAIIVSGGLWLVWFFFLKITNNSKPVNNDITSA